MLTSPVEQSVSPNADPARIPAMPAHRSWPDVAPTLNSSATADLSRAGDPPAARTASTAAACGITCPLPAAASKAADKAVVCVDARRSTAAVTRWWRRPQSASTASAPATTSSRGRREARAKPDHFQRGPDVPRRQGTAPRPAHRRVAIRTREGGCSSEHLEKLRPVPDQVVGRQVEDAGPTTAPAAKYGRDRRSTRRRSERRSRLLAAFRLQR